MIAAGMKKVWYHCGHCGSLFEEKFGLDEGRQCTACNQKPGTGIWPARIEAPTEVQREALAFDRRGETVEDTGRRAVRKKHQKNIMLRVVMIWTVLMLLAVGLRHYFTQNDEETQVETVTGRMTEGTLADERIALLNQALPVCHRTLGGFLTAGTPEARNQFVIDPIETAAKMASFYRDNSLPKVNVGQLQRVAQDVILVGSEWMVETRWKEKDGQEFDAIFRRDGGSWKLDWEHFSRYSEYPWTLFLAGDGPETAQFRLLARQLLVGTEAERTGARLAVVMIAPEFGDSKAEGVESPEFVMHRRSDEGLLLERAFEARSEDEKLFGRKLQPMENGGLVRVNVRVRREETGGIRKFFLEEVIACHWIDSPEVGYDLARLKDDLFGN